MKKHILICGEKGVGKSTLIRRLVEEARLTVGGFCTKMDENAEGAMRPIYIYPASLPMDQRKRGMENLVGRCGNFGRQKEIFPEAFNALGTAYLQGTSSCQVIIMDEPTVAVDPQSRNKILEGIQKLNEQGSTIIYTSHYMEEVEQICTRIAIMDHGRVIASGTTEELKKMIKTGETITVEAILLEEKHLQDIRNLSHVFDVHYENQILSLRCTGAQHNLIRLLNYLQSQDITFGRVFSELPTLNDVFLEITGKQLRD